MTDLTDATRSSELSEAPPAGVPAGGDRRPQGNDGAPLQRERRKGSPLLRKALVRLDAAALALAWLAVLLPIGARDSALIGPSVALATGLTGLGLWLLSASDLHRARVASMRMVEIARVARISCVLGLVAYAAATVAGLQVGLLRMAVGSGATFVLLMLGRGGYRAWLRARRSQGQFERSVVLVGIDEETAKTIRLLEEHPELGYDIIGVVGDRTNAVALGMGKRWLGPLEDAVPALHRHEATGAIVFPGAVPKGALNGICRSLVDSGGHVQLSSGLQGIDHRRLKPQPLSHEPFFHLEPMPVSLSPFQRRIKRAVDLVLTVVALVLLAPVLLGAAIAIKVSDPGPVLFRQERVGLRNRPFTIYKFRTMVVDAEARLEELAEANQRRGPLFKLDVDPRITKVGRFLRATSIDELPQLLNVLRGEMSLVGPRPALPSEVAEFDEDLQARTEVLPGITGLWQVEARDNPSFSAYRRLDLFYVENWSVSFDLVILLATVESEVARLIGRRSEG